MDPKLKKHLKDRPFALNTVRTAENLSTTPMTSELAQVSVTAMIAWAILDHADAVRELTAVLKREDGDS